MFYFITWAIVGLCNKKKYHSSSCRNSNGNRQTLSNKYSIYKCSYRHPLKISKNVPVVYDCARKIEVIAVESRKIKTIFIIMKLELSTRLLKLQQF